MEMTQYKNEKRFIENLVELRPKVSKVLDYILKEYNIGSEFNEEEGILTINTKDAINEGYSQLEIAKVLDYVRKNIDECFCDIKF